MLSRITRTLRSLVPLPAWWIVSRQMDAGARRLLDVGCGQGGPIHYIRSRRRLFAVGADIFSPYLRQHLDLGTYDGLVRCDVRLLPFAAGAFDVVFCGEMLEHPHDRGRHAVHRRQETLAHDRDPHAATVCRDRAATEATRAQPSTEEKTDGS